METLDTVDPELEIARAKRIGIACEVVERGKWADVRGKGRIGRRSVGRAGECYLRRLVVRDRINDFSIYRH